MLNPSRRRFLQIVAGTGVAVLIPGSPGIAASAVHRWDGVALGADATITLGGLSAAEAEILFGEVRSEIARLEALYSLYDPHSALSRLNATGAIAQPGPDFLRLMESARRVSHATGGAFDPTVQPLWRLYAESLGGTNPRMPSADEIASVRAVVDFNKVTWSDDDVAFGRDGMAMTLNGIAQGFITDQVVDLLRARGLESALVNLGEYRAIGRHPDARPWQVGIQDPRIPAGLVDIVDLAGEAVATSGGYCAIFGNDPKQNHLIDPRSGQSANRHLSVSVFHPSATVADGLSTAFSCLDVDEIRDATKRIGETRVLIVENDGALIRV